MSPTISASVAQSSSRQCSLDLRVGNFVFADSSDGVSVSIFDRCYKRAFVLEFKGVADRQRVEMFTAVLQLDSSTNETPPPHTPMPSDFLRLVLTILNTDEIYLNREKFQREKFQLSNNSLAGLIADYDRAISTSAVVKSSSELRVVRLGDSTRPAELTPVSLESLAESLRQLDLNDKPIWIDFNAANLNTRTEGLLRIALALGIDPTNIIVCAAEDPSRVSRRRSDNWWHFCSMAVDKACDKLEQGEILSSSIVHALVKDKVLITVHRGDQYSIERIMADMLQGGFCATGNRGKDGRPIGAGHLYSVILASMAHRAEDIARRVVEDAARKLEDRSVIGSQGQQALAGRIARAINVLRQFCDSFDNDITEMQTASGLPEYGFDTIYLSKHPGLVRNIEKWMNSISATVDNFYRQWQTAMDLVQNKSAVLLTRLLGALGTPAAVNSLADLSITSLKGASVAAISAAVGLVIVTLKPRLYGKKIQLG